jgi:SAM-dependent methyltransferase
MNLRKNIGYYFFASYRRKLIDKFLQENSHIYHGVVLDIGGRDRGKFKSPKNKVRKWIIADIEKSRNPDIVLDVANMHQINNSSIDIINAIELFEHVAKIEDGLSECFRVLKNDGLMIITIPFLYPVHADPYDFQRWTDTKWIKELTTRGFKIEKIEPMGKYFTVMADLLRAPFLHLPNILKLPFTVLLPIFDLLSNLDRFFKNNKFVDTHPAGYIIIVKK